MAFVDPIGHRYLDDPSRARRAAPRRIVESIRAGLVFGLKQAIGTDVIQASEERLLRHALDRWEHSPGIEILGSHRSARLPVISFRLRHGAQYLHHNFVVALLNDLFGIQARGGCSCAGPYGHRLLEIGPARSHALREEIGHGCDGRQARLDPGQLQLLHHRRRRDYIIDAVELIAADGYRLLPSYRFDPHTGLWRHAAAPRGRRCCCLRCPTARTVQMAYPRRRAQAGEDAFPGYLNQARALLASHPVSIDDGPTGLSPEFEALRWFPLPPSCLTPWPASNRPGAGDHAPGGHAPQ